MIRTDRFLISRKLYAVDLTSLTGTLDTTSLTPVYKGSINAVWFSRHKGRTTACIGTLADFQDAEPADAEEFLTCLTDGRRGGYCHGRWNGTSYWSDPWQPGQRDAHLAILQPMLATPTEFPAGYDGWWRF
ncbi:hypothetical protein ACH5A3_21315 [Streptomyces echinatus]|uniref:hypothetical protein n=1 Tax=Streptomyces echinatus TaxID=67293 RepID=UPI003794C76A